MVKSRLIKYCLAIKNGLKVNSNELMQLLRRSYKLKLDEDPVMSAYLKVCVLCSNAHLSVNVVLSFTHVLKCGTIGIILIMRILPYIFVAVSLSIFYIFFTLRCTTLHRRPPSP